MAERKILITICCGDETCDDCELFDATRDYCEAFLEWIEDGKRCAECIDAEQ